MSRAGADSRTRIGVFCLNGKRYWFDTKPTLNKLVVQYRQQSSGKGFDDEILEDLRSETQKGAGAGAMWRVLVNPAEDLPEQKSLTILVLPPSFAWDGNGNGKSKDAVRERVTEISLRCGGKDRIYRNTLLFLVAASRGLTKLRQAHREWAALEGVRADYGGQLDEEQKEDLRKRLEAARRAALEALGPAFTVVLRMRGQEVESLTLADARHSFQEHLGYVWATLVEDEEWILRRVGSVTLGSSGIVPKEAGLRLKDAVEAFLRFTDKPMVSSKEAVTSGIAQACFDGLVGIGRGASVNALQTRHCGQKVSLDPIEEGVWIIPPFPPETTKPASTGTADGTGSPTTGEKTKGAAEGGATSVQEKDAGRKVAGERIRRVVVRGAVPVENWGELFRCFVGPAARMNLKRLDLGVEFQMELPEAGLDSSDPAVKAMKEAARQLGLTFETD